MFENKPIVYIGWVWILEKIKAELRKEVRSKISNLIRSYNRPVSASIYWRNVRSIQFRQKLGLR